MILEVKNVSYYYKSQRDKLILDHVSYGFESVSYTHLTLPTIA